MSATASKSAQSRNKEREEGLAFARAWRERNKERFDAIYGGPDRCPTCGAPRS